MCFLLKLMLQQCGTQYELGRLLQLFVGIEHLFSDGKPVLAFNLLLEVSILNLEHSLEEHSGS